MSGSTTRRRHRWKARRCGWTMSRAACVPGRTSASTGVSARCSMTRLSAIAPKRAFGGRTAAKVRCHFSLPHCPAPYRSVEGMGRRPGLHGVSSVRVDLPPFPSPLRPWLPSSPPSPPCPPYVSVADHGAITPVFSVRLG